MIKITVVITRITTVFIYYIYKCMDRETIDYIIRYFSHLMTHNEKLVLKPDVYL